MKTQTRQPLTGKSQKKNRPKRYSSISCHAVDSEGGPTLLNSDSPSRYSSRYEAAEENSRQGWPEAGFVYLNIASHSAESRCGAWQPFRAFGSKPEHCGNPATLFVASQDMVWHNSQNSPFEAGLQRSRVAAVFRRRMRKTFPASRAKPRPKGKTVVEPACKNLTMLLVAFLTTASLLAAPATIYVDQNAAAGGNGSAGAPFQVIADAVAALALSNAVEQGGHTISVASGVYTEQVNFTADHAGTPAAQNILLGVGNPVIDAENVRTYGVNFDYAFDFMLKGFHITRAGLAVRMYNGGTTGRTENWTIDSCWIYNNTTGVNGSANYLTGTVIRNSAFFMNAGYAFTFRADVEVNQCVFLFNGQGQASGAMSPVMMMQYGWGRAWVTNSVFAGNAGVVGAPGANRYWLENCVVYENAGGLYTAGGGDVLDDMAVFESLGYGVNNIVADPGFANIAGLDFTKIYEGSPCIGGGVGGMNIGLPSLTTVPVSSNTYYVSTTGSDAYTKEQARNPITPWQTIQAGVNRSIAGDTLKIAEGTYNECVVITNSGTFDKPLSLIADGNVIIDGTTNTFYLYRTAGVILDGFEIISATTAGLNINHVYGCIFRHLDVNSGVIGALINIKTGKNYFYKCMFRGHSTAGLLAGTTGGQHYESCDFSNNTGIGAFLGYHNTFSRFYNCNFNYNGSIGYRQSQTTMPCFLRNCNFVGNGTHGVESWYSARPFIENSNITDNGIYGAHENTGGTTYFTNCNFYANVSGLLYDRPTTTVITTIGALNAFAENTANIAVNPMFKDPAAKDFRLQGGSACIDAGTPTTELETDYYGNPRLVGPAVDIGIFEAPPPGVIINFW